jgi:hypothetical protein
MVASGRLVEEDAAIDGAGDGNATSHLSSDSTESRLELSSLAAEEKGQRRRNIDVFGEAWLNGEVFREVIAKLSRRYSLFGAFYRYGEVCIRFGCRMK